jgi:ferritin-like metal-binding protein YciE
MKNQQSNPTTDSQNGKQSKTKSTSAPLQSSQLMKLFEGELKDIYWAEKALTKAIPKMIKNATDPSLIDALTNHLAETEKQVIRLVDIFESIDKKAVAKKCEAMEGLIKESAEIMDSCEAGAMRDAGIISAGQKVEHYEIASYGTLHQFAETLGLTKAVTLLAATLEEEKAANQQLFDVIITVVNIEDAIIEK